MADHNTPGDLASLLRTELLTRGCVAPAVHILEDLFQTMYGASLRTEEGEAITFHVCFVDPHDPDPEPPPRIRRYRWRSFPLVDSVPFTEAHLTKLAKASDPRTSALAVYVVDGHLQVWGLIDQGNLYFDWVNRESEEVHGYRPGLFQASIEGPAHLTVWIDLERIGELRGTHLTGHEIDALGTGPLHDAFQSARTRFHETVLAAVSDPTLKDDPYVDDVVERNWVEALARVVLRAQRFRHGGAFLITPDPETGLNVKYGLLYGRLREALLHNTVHQLAEYSAREAIYALMDGESPSVPMDLFITQRIEDHELHDSRLELTGIAWFVSLLTRVDGLVLLTPDLDVVGYGVEITFREDPPVVMLAADAEGVERSSLDPNNYGTRHRSMMRYCAAVPGSVGIVISQDGDVRAMTVVDGILVVWVHVKLQAYEVPQEDAASEGGHDEPK